MYVSLGNQNNERAQVICDTNDENVFAYSGN